MQKAINRLHRQMLANVNQADDIQVMRFQRLRSAQGFVCREYFNNP